MEVGKVVLLAAIPGMTLGGIPVLKDTLQYQTDRRRSDYQPQYKLHIAENILEVVPREQHSQHQLSKLEEARRFYSMSVLQLKQEKGGIPERSTQPDPFKCFRVFVAIWILKVAI